MEPRLAGELWGRGAAEVKWQLNGLQDAFSHQFCSTVSYDLHVEFVRGAV